MTKSKILVTGVAGFIGFHLTKLLLEKGFEVVGLDNLNNYYSVKLKKDRLSRLLNGQNGKNLIFHVIDIKDKLCVDSIFKSYNPTYVINLAAQAGVRYSLTNPYSYLDSNIIGFLNILEACRKFPVKHLLYASSSSVYGGNKMTPFSTNDKVDHPMSLYAATKKSNELMAHTYSHLYEIPTTGLRFFTVYGPFGRPDMAYFSFTKEILEGNPIKIFNHGKMERDFTYIDDITEAVYKLLDKPPVQNTPYKIYNLGNNNPVPLMRFIAALETALAIKAEKTYLDMQPGDVLKTYADVTELEKAIGFKPSTSIEEGISKFVKWYKEYYLIA